MPTFFNLDLEVRQWIYILVLTPTLVVCDTNADAQQFKYGYVDGVPPLHLACKATRDESMAFYPWAMLYVNSSTLRALRLLEHTPRATSLARFTMFRITGQHLQDFIKEYAKNLGRLRPMEIIIHPGSDRMFEEALDFDFWMQPKDTIPDVCWDGIIKFHEAITRASNAARGGNRELYVNAINDAKRHATTAGAEFTDLTDLKRQMHDKALLLASEAGDEEEVELLLDEGADVNAQGGEYGNALQAASYGGHAKVVELLLDKGADVDAQGGEYGNALLAASYQGHAEVVGLLLDNEADVRAEDEAYGSALQAASNQGHWNVMRLLLYQGGLETDYPTLRKARSKDVMRALMPSLHDMLQLVPIS